MLGHRATGLVTILTFSRRTDCLTGPAKVIDVGDTIVADQLIRLHGIDAPELDQPLWWQGQKLMGGMMALAALDVLTAGVKVRCKAVEPDRHGRIVAKVFSPNGVDVGRRLCRQSELTRQGHGWQRYHSQRHFILAALHICRSTARCREACYREDWHHHSSFPPKQRQQRQASLDQSHDL